MRAKRTVQMMVLVVHIRGDHAADRDEFRIWNDRWEPASRYEHIQDVGEQHTGFAGK